MTFLWPIMLVFLLAVPLLVVFLRRIQRRRNLAAARYASFGLAPVSQPTSRRLPPVLFIVSITLLIVALARPQMELSLPRIEGIVILAFDTSGSMAADDMQPTRLEAAKTLAREFAERQPPQVLVGVVAFSDSGFSVQAPTQDTLAVNAALDRLAPQRSTSISTAIAVSLDTIAKVTGQLPEDAEDFPPELLPTPTPAPEGVFSPGVIVLISDGENTSRGDPLEVAREAARRGVRIHTIGVGSPNGAVLEIDGFMVHTRLDESMLREIAQTTSGSYYNAATEDELRGIYEQIQPQWIIKREKTELTALLSGLGILLLLAGAIPSLVWYGRVL